MADLQDCRDSIKSHDNIGAARYYFPMMREFRDREPEQVDLKRKK
jgi:hypothetical protein